MMDDVLASFCLGKLSCCADRYECEKQERRENDA